MNTSTEKTLPEKTWQIAATLAHETARDRLALSGPFTLSPEIEFMEPIILYDMYRPEKVASHLLRELKPLADLAVRQEASAESVLSDHCRTLSLISFLDCIAAHLEKGHTDFFREPLDDRTAEDAVFDIFEFLWMYQLDAEVQLIFTSGSFDAFEPLPAGRGDASRFPRSITVYPNLYLYHVLGNLLVHAGAHNVEDWTPRRDALGKAIRRFFLDSDTPTLRNGAALDPDAPFADADWSPHLPHATALFLACNLVEASLAAQLFRNLKQHLDNPEAGCLGMSTLPPPPAHLLSAYHFQGWTHVPGSNHTQMCARSARLLHQAGCKELANDLLVRLAERAVSDGGFYPWYSPDGCPQGAQLDPLAARAFLNALEEIHPIQLHRPRQEVKSTLPLTKPGKDFLTRKSRNRPRLHEQAFEEKREARRVPIEIHAMLRTGGFLNSRESNVSVRFPSQTGLAIHCSTEIPVGDRVRLVLDASPKGGPKECKLTGRVVWTRPKIFHLLHMCGVELTPGKGDHRAWRSFIETKLEKSKKNVTIRD